MSLLVWANVDEQFTRDSQLRREDVARLEEWQRQQPHLPAPLHPIETLIFLHSCHYSSEKAKKRIDAFFTMRTHAPEFFANRDPLGSEMQQALDRYLCTPLPHLTPEGYMVFYCRLCLRNADLFNLNAAIKVFSMVGELAQRQGGCHHGQMCVIDLEGVTLTHLLKCPLVSVRKMMAYLQHASPLRNQTVHFVNGSSILDKVWALFRPFIRHKLLNRVHFHRGDNSTILTFLPKDILPVECGGSKLCATEYYENVTRKTIEGNSAYFKLQEGQLVDESRRPGKPTNVTDLFGVEGTFRKLDLD